MKTPNNKKYKHTGKDWSGRQTCTTGYKTPKGSIIPGYLLTELTPWGEIWGKVSLTGKSAEQEFGFIPSKDAKGIIFRRYTYIDPGTGTKKRGTFISSLIPPYNPKTLKQRRHRRKIATLTKLIAGHRKDLINPIWNPLSPTKEGFGLFIKTNMPCMNGKYIQWTKLLLSDGILHPQPYLIHKTYDPITGKIQIELPLKLNPLIGITLLDTTTRNLYHIPPSIIKYLYKPDAIVPVPPNLIIKTKPSATRKYHKPPSPSSLFLFLYLQSGNNYSPSWGSCFALLGKRPIKRGIEFNLWQNI